MLGLGCRQSEPSTKAAHQTLCYFRMAATSSSLMGFTFEG